MSYRNLLLLLVMLPVSYACYVRRTEPVRSRYYKSPPVSR